MELTASQLVTLESVKKNQVSLSISMLYWSGAAVFNDIAHLAQNGLIAPPDISKNVLGGNFTYWQMI